MVRAAPDDGDVLVTVLSAGGALPNADSIANARAGLDIAGGRVTLDSVPHAELWVPS